MSNHNIIFIRSQDRNSGLANAFSVNLPTQYNSISSIQLLSAEIPCSFYSISASYAAGVTFTNGWNIG